MRIIVISLAFFISACNSIQQAPEQKVALQNPYDSRYEMLVNTLQDAPSVIEIVELRQVYVLTNRYRTNATAEQTLNQQLFKAMANDNWEVCLERAYQALELNYTSLNGHYGAMACSFESAKVKQGRYHESMLNMLLEAVWTTGDGQSASTAFFSTSQIDIAAFIEFHGLEIVRRTRLEESSKPIDVVTVRDPESGEHFDWFFASHL